MTRKPCKTCPWRRDVPPHGFPGGHISPALRERAAGGMGPAMQCHSTPDGEGARVCVGFAARVGYASPGLRIAAVLGHYHPSEIDVTDVDLWETADDLYHVHGEGAR